MNSFTDYYTLLGVEKDASPGVIKAAFKKLALQYHPDVYKGEDAHERMRLLLLAYQTLNDPTARKQYDSVRSEYTTDAVRGHVSRAGNTHATPGHATSGSARKDGSERSPGARRDRQRYYDFPDIRDGQPLHIDLIDCAYILSASDARVLVRQGMLRGSLPETEGHTFYCHRCHHRWSETTVQRKLPRYCPHCHAGDWAEYLLLRCVHCCAVFESEQIRYEIGTYTYGKGNGERTANLCPPYELFPLCPYCGTAHWCPAENERVSVLRKRAEERTARIRMLWIGAVVIAMVVVMVMGGVALGVFR